MAKPKSRNIRPAIPNRPKSRTPRQSGPKNTGVHNSSKWDYQEARNKERIRRERAKTEKMRLKNLAKYGDSKTTARRDKIAAVSSNIAEIGATITGNIQGVEAQETERARINAEAAYKYANLINAAQGQTGNTDTGADDTNVNPKPNNNSNPAGGPSDFGW